MGDLTDEQVLAMLKSGDSRQQDQAFRCLYQHYKKIEAHILKNSGTVDDAETVFHDGLLILFQKVVTPGFELTSRLSSFLFGICKNKWLEALRKKNRHQTQGLDAVQGFIDDELTPEEILLDEEKRNRLRLWIEVLSENCKKLVMLFYYENKSMNEIAEILSFKNSDSAKSQKRKCLKKLIEEIGNDPELSSQFS